MMSTVPVARRGLAALALAGWLAGAAAAEVDHLSDDIVPDPAHSPTDVVRFQLEALRNNDATDRGMAVAFRFASPGNRAATGPLPRFARMIRNGLYALMLDYREAIYDTLEVRGDQALQRVVLVGVRETVRYDFRLSRQTESPYENCWMTDAVGAHYLGGAMALAPGGNPHRG